MPKAAKTRRTIAETAVLLGVSERTINEWRAKGCPITAPLEEVEAWRAANVNPRRGGIDKRNPRRSAARDLDELHEQWKTWKLTEEARAQRMKNNVQSGDQLNTDDAALCVAEMTGRIRARLESIASELETEWQAKSRSMITEAIASGARETLLRLSTRDYGETEAPEPEDGSEPCEPPELPPPVDPNEDLPPREALTRAKIHKLAEEWKGKHMTNEEKESRLISRERVNREVGELMAIVRRDLLAMPEAIAAHAPPEHRSAVLERLRDKVALVVTEMDQTKFPWND